MGFLRGLCRVTKQVGLGALETFSRGVGDGRYISVMRAGAAPKRVQKLSTYPAAVHSRSALLMAVFAHVKVDRYAAAADTCRSG
jgi:hypothetical protein